MLAVVHAHRYVGTLRPNHEGIEFVYAPQWLRLTDAFPLSPRLALREEPWSGAEVLFFFANLLPEGRILDALAKLRRLPSGNVYRLLEAFGLECAGAFEIVPAGQENLSPAHEPVYKEYTQRQLKADLAKARDNIPLLARHADLRLSLAGAQNKIPLRYADNKLWLPTGDAPSTHILKPALQPEKLFPHAVANEAFCLHLASAIGINAPAATVLTDPEPILLVERYDRVEKDGRVERLHQLDFCQLAGVLPENKYEPDGGPGFNTCFDQVDTYSAPPAADRLQLVDRVIFNYLIGNADAHAKNLSMLYQANGSLRLAPAYDLLATGYWPDLSKKMAMAIGSEKRPAWVQARHWQRFCESLGLNPTQLRKRALELCTKALVKKDDITAELPIPERLAQHFSRTLEHNGKLIEKRLGLSE